MKKSILISYQAMMVGGSTTSLLGLLYSFDYSRYDVDLLLNTNTGEMLDKIPNQVNLLPPAYKHPNHRIRKFHSLLSPRYVKAYIQSKAIAKKSCNVMHGVQYLESQDVIRFREIDKEYDVAIAFLEGINCKFVANHIKAKKKIAWIHIDYEASGFNPIYDIEAMTHFHNIVTVSSKCRESFCRSFPSLRDRVYTIENILSCKNINNLANATVNIEIDKNYINLVSSCRVEFQAKALDRAVSVWSKMNKKGELDRLRWYIIGDGKDFMQLKQLISDSHLENHIFLLGKKVTPYPYIKKMDIFFLPSRFEGKPMSVTEGLILGIPALVTNYSSAKDQIKDGFSGLVVDNNEDGIEYGLKYLTQHKDEIETWKFNVKTVDYNDNKPLQQIYELIEN